jgi:hypothetical protein
MRCLTRSPLVVYFTAAALLGSCQDMAVDLSGNYFYRDEGGDIKDILYREGDGEIPATVLDYAFNNDFIIAKQRPKVPAEPLYARHPIYVSGLEHEYYWIIDHAHDTIWGPLLEEEYLRTRDRIGVPTELALH